MTRPTPTQAFRNGAIGSGKPIVLAAGGTGGHMFPAEALASLLMAQGERVVLVTDRRGAAIGDKLPDMDVHTIRAASPSGGLMAKVSALRDLVIGYGEARGILRALSPACVVGFGGYPTAPTIFAAGRLSLPILLHEQNAVAGRVNRLLAGMAKQIAVSFPDPKGLKPRDQKKTVLTGNPVRPAIRDFAASPYSAPTGDAPVRLVILGGSQGARILSDVVPEALAALTNGLRNRLQVTQQARPEDLERVRKAYADANIEATVESFFTDIPELLKTCHLAITRAGASTTAELTVVGRPAILVPYPFAMDDHQSANAASLARQGGAWVIDQAAFTKDRLTDQLNHLFDQSVLLESAAAAMAKAGIADADRRLGNAVQALAGLNPQQPGGNGNGMEDSAAPSSQAATVETPGISKGIASTDARLMEAAE